MRSIALLSLALIGCKHGDSDTSSPRPIVPGSPMIGAAEGTLDMPIGTPLGGYSDRATYIGHASKQDNRQSAYTVGFVPSTGVHTRPGIKVIWVNNGDQDLVITQTDTIYSFDGLVTQITAELERRTGLDLQGRVVHATNHSHNSYGPFCGQTYLYLGGDKFNEEIFQRFVGEVADVAMRAHDSMVPGAIGTGWVKDWDPDDKVYHDRRGENDSLVMFDDLPPGGYGKEPFLNVTRFDTAAGDPLAMIYVLPIHGTAIGDDSSLASSEASGGISAALEEEFDRPVVIMHLQSGAGDASPSGTDERFARVESLGEYAKGPIMDLYRQVQVSDAPISLETVSRSIPEARDQIAVTRNGTTDLKYAPFVDGQTPDEVVYDTNGAIKSPIDEFNAQYGGVFCGATDPLIPAGGIGSNTYPYSTCMDVGLVTRILLAIFHLEESDIVPPLPETLKAGTLATVFGPIPTLMPDGTQVTQPLYASFFPGEPTSMYVEQMRRRVKAELGYAMPLVVGYSQDHEGYLLPPEDWLMGGYEPNINVWGPLQGEHIMEGVLEYSKDILSTTDVAEDANPDGTYDPTQYADVPLPTEFVPDLTPEAGTPITVEQAQPLWVVPGFVDDFSHPSQVRRVQGVVQFQWFGGDVMVDEPHVVVEREDNGVWNEVTTAAGRPLSDNYTDILMGYSPDPLYPIADVQKHRFWVAWQAVSHMKDREGFPLGHYRLHVHGQKYTGGSTQWPWASAPYDLTSYEFDVLPAEITVDADAAGLLASIRAPSDGWRLVDIDGSSMGDNPVRGTVHVALQHLDGSSTELDVAPDAITGGRSHLPLDLTDIVGATVTDGYGNSGVWSAD